GGDRLGRDQGLDRPRGGRPAAGAAPGPAPEEDAPGPAGPPAAGGEDEGDGADPPLPPGRALPSQQRGDQGDSRPQLAAEEVGQGDVAPLPAGGGDVEAGEVEGGGARGI